MSRIGWAPVILALVWAGCGGDGEAGASVGVTQDAGGTPDTGSSVSSDTFEAPDTGPAADTGADTGTNGGTEPRIKEFIPCSENSDCDSGFCVESADGKTCTETCLENCPKDWRCSQVSNTGTDSTFICLPRFLMLCKPCVSDADCASNFGAGLSTCLDYGPEGRFCGSECSDDAPCPEGYACDGGQCRREVGECECSWKAIKDGASTVCEAANELGACTGARTCIDGTLSACDAPTPVAELCDAADNDCDGQTDEELGGDPCQNASDFGVCAGVTVCDDGVIGCNAATATLEVCDGVDNDCSGAADDGFPDSNGDGTADCVSLDDDADGILDVDDNCPVDANPEQDDQDGDEVGDACDNDIDGDGDLNVTDCAPYDPAVGSKNTEICNGLDDDCDTSVDETFSDLDGNSVADCVDPDDDGDGVVDEEDNCPVTANSDQTDSDGDGKGDACDTDTDDDGDPDDQDCEPLNPLVHHAATESCNGIDENCNGFIDEGFPDTDGDGVADCLDTDDDGDGTPDTEDNCPLDDNPDQLDLDTDGLGDVCDTDDDGDGDPDALDCAPTDPTVNHQATEVCNQKDDDCDLQTDEEGAVGCEAWYYNGDGDTYGLADLEKCLCQAAPPWSAALPGDCDDTNSQVFPGANEVCNLKDDDCDTDVDEGAAVGCQDAFADGDNDGVGTGAATCVCPGTAGYAPVGGDCDDGNSSIKPGAIEACNGADDDCDSQTDEAGATGCEKYYLDEDDDQVGLLFDSQCLCAPTGDYTALASGDCDDSNPLRFPGNAEVCDEIDNNCNGVSDEGVQTTYYVDNDDDEFGAGYNTKEGCTAPEGYVPQGGDCNDFNGDINPAESESCDEIDNNCNGQTDEGLPQSLVYVDLDGDGFGAQNTLGVSSCLLDGDDDGVGESAPVGFSLNPADCNDSASLTYPGAPELCDGMLNDCDVPVADFQCPSLCQGEWPVEVGVTSGYAVVGQLDSDNAYEIVVQGGNQVRVLNADGSLKWQKSATVQYSNPLLADMDLDGYMDVVLIETGAFTVLDGNTGDELESFVVTSTGWRPGIAFDLDNDGIPDIAGAATSDVLTVLLRDGNGGAKSVIQLTPPAGTYFSGDVASAADLDGDGVAEIIVGTGYYTCNGGNAPACNGKLLVYDVLTGALKYPADTFLVPDAGNAHAGGQWPFVGDLDGDGSREVFHAFGNAVLGAAGHAWAFDGTTMAPTTPVSTGSMSAAPVDFATGVLTDGALHHIGAAAADMDGDGDYEMVRATGSGLLVYSDGALMDGFPFGVAGGSALAVDVNRDNQLDVLYVGSENSALNCVTFGAGTHDESRLLHSGSADGFSAGRYRMSSYDPWEPNDRTDVPFDPVAAASDPIAASRAFPLRGFRDVLTSSSGWRRRLIGVLGHEGDHDFYWAEGTQINVTLQSLMPGVDADLYVHMYSQDGPGSWTYATTLESTGTGLDAISCVNSDPCPNEANKGMKTFIIEVRPKDPTVDYGPWPYQLRILFGAQ